MPATFRSSLCALLFLLASPSFAQAPDSGPPYRVGGNVTRPEKVSGSPPEYTIEARQAQVQGVVILEAVIDEQGDVKDVRVLKGLPEGLDQAALEAVRTWKFEPARMDGKPVPVYYTLTVNFTMEEGPKLLRAKDVFWELAMKHPELEAHMRAGNLEEALALVQGMADSPEIHFARAFLLTGLRRPREAFQEAQGAKDGIEREMLYQLLALYALMELSERKAGEPSAETIDVGLQAATAALEARKESKEAMLTKSRLLREKAKLTEDQAARQALLEEAGELEKRAGAAP